MVMPIPPESENEDDGAYAGDHWLRNAIDLLIDPYLALSAIAESPDACRLFAERLESAAHGWRRAAEFWEKYKREVEDE